MSATVSNWDGVRLQGVVEASASVRAARRLHNRGGLYRLTPRARTLLHPVVFRNDHGPKCTCGDCVMRRLRKSGKLASWSRAQRMTPR